MREKSFRLGGRVLTRKLMVNCYQLLLHVKQSQNGYISLWEEMNTQLDIALAALPR